MNILIFSHEFPPMAGGAGTYVDELSKAFVKLGHKVKLIVGDTKNVVGDKYAIDSAKGAGISITRHKWIYSNRLWFLTNISYYKRILAKESDADLVIFGNYTSHIVAHRALKNVTCNYMIVLHGDDIDYFQRRDRLKDKVMISKKQMKEYFERASKVISVSKYLENIVLSYDPELKSKSQVILHGIEMPNQLSNETKIALKDRLQQHTRNDAESLIITYVSRFAKGKGQDTMVMAMKYLLELNSDYFLIFIGDGEEKENVKNLVNEMGISKSVMFTGALSRNEVFKYLSIAKLNVFLSNRYGETFGIVIIESMAVGTPVLAFNTGGVPEAIQDGKTGVLLNTINPQNIAERISELILDKNKYRKMRVDAFDVAHSYFNSQRMALETIS